MQLAPNITSAITVQASKPDRRSFYLYDPSVMRGKIAKLKTQMPKGVAIYYAMKANPHAAFLKAALDGGLAGIEIASQGEGEKAIAAGFKADQLIFTGPGKFAPCISNP
jgi:diaminopimelate decarboxylase